MAAAPRTSVIIAVHNHSEGRLETLATLAAQTIADLEGLLAARDGSSCE